MPEGPIRYWYNDDTRRIHKHTCPHCGMDERGRQTWQDAERAHWLGPYETLGAAIDVAVSMRDKAILCGTCLYHGPSITTA